MSSCFTGCNLYEVVVVLMNELRNHKGKKQNFILKHIKGNASTPSTTVGQSRARDGSLKPQYSKVRRPRRHLPIGGDACPGCCSGFSRLESCAWLPFV